MQPAIVLDLGFQLARRPAGITQRQDGMLGTRALRDRLQDVDGRGEADVVIDPQRRILDEKVAGMQHETAAGIDRTALQHLHRLAMVGHLDLVRALDDVELHQKLRKVDAPCRMIDDDAHGALGGMRAQVDHRTLEARVAHHGHRDQHLAVEITLVRRIVPDAGLAARALRCFAFRSHPQSLSSTLLS